MFKKVIFVLTLLCFQSLIASDIINIDKSVLPEFLKDGQVKVKGKILKDGKYRANNRREGNSYWVFSVKNGLLNGPYIRYYGNGIKEEEGFYKDAKLDGPSVVYYDNGNKKLEGFFKNGGLEGIKTMYFDDGNKYLTVSYHNDIEEGPFTQYYPSGEKRAEGFHKSGKLDGLLITYVNFSRDQDYGPTFGKKDPQLGKYHFKAMEKFYRNGKIQGKYTYYYTRKWKDGFYPIKNKFSKLKDSAYAVYGKGKKEYILFMDPKCGYCKKFEQLFPGLYNDVTFYIYLIDKSNANLREALNVSGTPTVFDISGEQVLWTSFTKLSEKNKKRGLIFPKYTIIKGLMWQDDEEREVYYSPLIRRQTNEKDWYAAVEYCRDLNYAGYSDWTLPSKNQLLTLFNYKSKLNYNPPYNFWSSTVHESDPGNAWTVEFYYKGNMRDYGKTRLHDVRCVREVQ